MSFLLVTLSEFGQFLMILLWISIPLIIITLIVVSYFHYRRKKMVWGEDLFSSSPGSVSDSPIDGSGAPLAGEKPYQGLLWLKRKYEHDMGQADTRYFELREEFKKLEKNYIDLRVNTIGLEQQLTLLKEGLPGNTQEELEGLDTRLAEETGKVKDLEKKLESCSQLLMKMYKELAASLEANNTLPKNRAQENRIKGLVKEFDAIEATIEGGTGQEERKISSWSESRAVEDIRLEQKAPEASRQAGS